MSENDERLRDEAVQQIKRRREFWQDLVSYVIVNAGLIVVWAITGAGYFWPGWVLGGWGIGLLFHAWATFGQKPIHEDEIRREMDRLRRRAGARALTDPDEIARDGDVAVRAMRDAGGLRAFVRWRNEPHVAEWWNTDDDPVPMTVEHAEAEHGPGADAWVSRCIDLRRRPAGGVPAVLSVVRGGTTRLGRWGCRIPTRPTGSTSSSASRT